MLIFSHIADELVADWQTAESRIDDVRNQLVESIASIAKDVGIEINKDDITDMVNNKFFKDLGYNRLPMLKSDNAEDWIKQVLGSSNGASHRSAMFSMISDVSDIETLDDLSIKITETINKGKEIEE